MSLAHNLVDAQIDHVKNLVEQGSYGEAWSTLASMGDRYADNAYLVVARPEGTGDFFGTLVEKHWDNTAGAGAYDANFDAVAEKHLTNYLNIMSDSGNWPNTEEIEGSYRESVEYFGMPAATAFDGVFTQALGNSLFDWPTFLNIEAERQVDSDVFSDIDSSYAREILLDDVLETYVELRDAEKLTQATGEQIIAFLEAIGEQEEAFFDELGIDFLKFAFNLGDTINHPGDAIHDSFNSALN